MGAVIRNLVTKPQLLARERAAELRQMVLQLEGEAPRAVAQLVAVLDRNTAAERQWSFVMLSPMQNRAVVRWINENAKRPRISAALWAECFCHLRTDTGEVVMTRADMLKSCGTKSSSIISDALSELVGIGALIRHQEGREVRFFMNPKVATCLTGKAREDAQSDAPLTVHDLAMVRRHRDSSASKAEEVSDG